MPNGNIRILGLPRYSLGSLASGATVDAGKPLSKLVNREPWDVARLTQVDPALAYVEASPTMPLGYYGPTPRVRRAAA